MCGEKAGEGGCVHLERVEKDWEGRGEERGEEEGRGRGVRVCAFRKSGERLGGERGVGTRENMAVNITVRDTISYPCYTYPLPPTACVLVLNKRCSVDSCSGCTQTEQQAECRQGYSPSTFSLVLPCTCRYNGRPSLRMRNILITNYSVNNPPKCPLLVNFENWQVLVGSMNTDKQLYIPNKSA